MKNIDLNEEKNIKNSILMSKSISDGYLTVNNIFVKRIKNLKNQKLMSVKNEEIQKSRTTESSIMCRICQVEGDDVLIHLCHCKGAIGYYHYECLVIWLQTSQRTSCELCNYNFSTSTKLLSFKKVILKIINLIY